MARPLRDVPPVVYVDARVPLPRRLESVDVRLTRWMASYGPKLLRISLGVVFFWFGVLKFFPGLSPAQDLAGRTIAVLSFGWIQPEISLPLLAAWECAIGIGLISGVWMRFTLLLLLLQMLGTLTPVVLFPQEVFLRAPYAPTLEGQYIIKNFVLVSGALVLGAMVRGGSLVADPPEIPGSRGPNSRP